MPDYLYLLSFMTHCKYFIDLSASKVKDREVKERTSVRSRDQLSGDRANAWMTLLTKKAVVSRLGMKTASI